MQAAQDERAASYDPLAAMQLVSPVSPVDDAVHCTARNGRQVAIIIFRPLGHDRYLVIPTRNL